MDVKEFTGHMGMDTLKGGEIPGTGLLASPFFKLEVMVQTATATLLLV